MLSFKMPSKRGKVCAISTTAWVESADIDILYIYGEMATALLP